MAWLKENILLVLISVLFFMSIILISYSLWLSALVGIFLLIIIYVIKVKDRTLISIFLAFLMSFFIFQLANLFLIEQFNISKELRVLVNRSLLMIIVAGLCFAHLINKQQLSFFNQKPNWGNRLYSLNIFRFWIIGLVMNVAFLTPFIILQGLSYIKSVLLFALLFSLINSVLEEVIWRGILLSSLQKVVSIRYALIITSVGFGLLHLAIGIPMIVSLLFSFAGFFYGIIVLKTDSIYPAIIHHFVINLGMVLSGWLL